MDNYAGDALFTQSNDVMKQGVEPDLLQLEDRLARLELFETLDGVLQAFLDTNVWQGKYFSFADLLEISSKRHLRYEHLSIPYRATVTIIEDYDATWLCIKLANNGFQYTAKSGRWISKHEYNSWYAMDCEECLQHFPHLQSAAKRLYDDAKVFYTIGEQVPHLMVTFKEGYPDWTDSVTKIQF
jgi:hypothetical protein